MIRFDNKQCSFRYERSVFGVSAIVDPNDDDKLVVGNPYTYFGSGNHPGSIGQIEGRILRKASSSEVPWKSRESKNGPFKLAGYSLGTGKFFSRSDESLVVGAPKAHNHKGAVYICHNCFKKSRLAL